MALLAWKDLSDAYAAHRSALLSQAGKWLLGWLVAIILFTLLLLYSRHTARQQMARHAEAISAQSQRRERDRQLLEIISRSQSDYIQQNDFAAALQQLLEQILALTHFTRADFFQARPDAEGGLHPQRLSSSASAPLPDDLQSIVLRFCERLTLSRYQPARTEARLVHSHCPCCLPVASAGCCCYPAASNRWTRSCALS
ncbi:hypothetical protein ULF88_10505 [Halopseudomonas pachastrellae]|nr:hypothetical protein [Halopseudomonas pachastrellae]